MVCILLTGSVAPYCLPARPAAARADANPPTTRPAGPAPPQGIE